MFFLFIFSHYAEIYYAKFILHLPFNLWRTHQNVSETFSEISDDLSDLKKGFFLKSKIQEVGLPKLNIL